MQTSEQQDAQFALSFDTLSFERVFVLGDSLVDSGNALGLAEWYDDLPFTALPEGTPTAELGYFDGRFSNGYTYADLVANRYTGSPSEAVFPYGYDDPWIGIPIAPFRGDPRGDSLNFAYGGAQIIRGPEFVSGLDEQTDALRDAVDGSFSGQELAVITMGGNDIRRLAPVEGDPATRYHANIAIQGIAAELLSELGQLASRGLQSIVITGIPDVGLVPQYDIDGDGILAGSPDGGGGWKGYFEEYHRALRATEYSADLDHLIRTEVVPQLEAMGLSVTYVPLATVFDESGNVIVDGALDMVLPSIAALNGLTVEAMKADWLEYSDLVFFDAIHPTAQVHALVGSYIHAQMEGYEWIEIMPMDALAASAVFSGAISVAGELDSFEVMLKKGQTYVADLLGMSALGADGSLADGTLVFTTLRGHVLQQGYEAGSGSDNGLGFDGHYVFTAPYTGRYVLLVGGEGSLTGDYEIRFAQQSSADVELAAAFAKDASQAGATVTLDMIPELRDEEPLLGTHEFLP